MSIFKIQIWLTDEPAVAEFGWVRWSSSEHADNERNTGSKCTVYVGRS